MRTASSKSNRLEHLDSLRGIAALAVALFHCLIRFSGPDQLGINALLGSCAVLFFFVLSGFVLGRSLERSPASSVRSYAAYACRRVLRLYPAIFLALLVFAAINMLPAPPKSSLSVEAFMWPQYDILHQHPRWWLEELLLLRTRLCPVMWSLQAEFLCSLLLPIAAGFCANSNARQLSLCVLFAILMTPAFFSGLSLYLPTNPISHSPLQYFFAFHLGYLINKIPDLNALVTPPRSLWILTLGLLALVPIGSFGTSYSLGFSALPVSVSILFAVLLAALVPGNIPALSKFLHSAPLAFIGRCSYSFYLLHCAAIHLGLWILHLWLPGLVRHPVLLPALALFCLTLAISLPLAALAERFVERPCNQFGHRLSKGILTRKPN